MGMYSLLNALFCQVEHHHAYCLAACRKSSNSMAIAAEVKSTGEFVDGSEVRRVGQNDGASVAAEFGQLEVAQLRSVLIFMFFPKIS